MIQPMLINNNIYQGLSQIVDADAVFIRDFMRLDRLNAVYGLDHARRLQVFRRGFALADGA
jgi:hypothetical protein